MPRVNASLAPAAASLCFERDREERGVEDTATTLENLLREAVGVRFAERMRLWLGVVMMDLSSRLTLRVRCAAKVACKA